MKKLIHLGARTKVPSNEIIKLEAKENYTLVYFTDGNKLLSSTNLGILEDRLKTHSFFRVNRSIVINLEYLSQFRVVNPKIQKPVKNNSNSEELILARRRVKDFEAKSGSNFIARIGGCFN